MQMKSLLVRPWLVTLLVVAIVATRSNYSNALLDPPDATLAAFFIAGLLAPTWVVFALLFGAAALADQLAFASGVIDWCFTPAYAFLVPTYASLWFAGYLLRGTHMFQVSGLLRASALLAVGCAVAYVISSHSFFMFSGRFAQTLTAADYWASILKYFPMYVGWAFFYAACAYGVALVAHTVAPRAAAEKH